MLFFPASVDRGQRSRPGHYIFINHPDTLQPWLLDKMFSVNPNRIGIKYSLIVFGRGAMSCLYFGQLIRQMFFIFYFELKL